MNDTAILNLMTQRDARARTLFSRSLAAARSSAADGGHSFRFSTFAMAYAPKMQPRTMMMTPDVVTLT